MNGQHRTGALFEWAPGNKAKPEHSTFVFLGEAAAQIHMAADTFSPSWIRDYYDTAVLIDEQLRRMNSFLHEAGYWQQMVALGERLKRLVANPNWTRESVIWT